MELVIFDLDGTLNLSKQPIDGEMVGLLCGLMSKTKVAVISGGSLAQFEISLLNNLSCGDEAMRNLYLMPTNGASLYENKNGWQAVYIETLSASEKEKIMAAFRRALTDTGFVRPEKTYGEILEDRTSQITFSAFGQKAPLELKTKWDPTRVKRLAIASRLKEYIPEFEIGVAGTTSIDVTRSGIDKAYGIKKIMDYLKIKKEDIVFVGDSLFEGGNDHPAIGTGVRTIAVSGAEETKRVISGLL